MGVTKRNQKKFTKRNEILLLAKQNETKRNFACFLFRETSEISRNNLFRFVSCFAKQKSMRNGNPSQIEHEIAG
jgi:c-di-GMP-binding flagellar brake protein YcgR